MKKWYNRVFLNDIRRAIDDFHMIEDGDRILIGISGGKDSTFLVFALDLLRKYSYKKFDIVAVHVDYDFALHTMKPMESYCKDNGIEYHNELTDLHLVMETDKIPCYICGRLRKGVLARVVKELGCTKLALGHHMDDAVETFFMNLLYNGKVGAFKPSSINKKNEIKTIRPLIYVKEDIITKVVQSENLPICDYQCAFKDSTKRSEIKELIRKMSTEYSDIREKVITSLKNPNMDNFWIGD